MHNRAKFHADRSNHCRDIVIFGFSGWWPPNFKFVTVKRVELRHIAKFRRNR